MNTLAEFFNPEHIMFYLIGMLFILAYAVVRVFKKMEQKEEQLKTETRLKKSAIKRQKWAQQH